MPKLFLEICVKDLLDLHKVLLFLLSKFFTSLLSVTELFFSNYRVHIFTSR